MKILAVDFDGVISDSALKSLFVSHNAYCKYFGSEVKRNFGGKLFTFENWEEILKVKQNSRVKARLFSIVVKQKN